MNVSFNVRNTVLLLTSCLIGCTSIKKSPFSRYNEFTYSKEQPQFHFRNRQLRVEGEWHWATAAREIPAIKYLPHDVSAILRPLTKRNGPVLFATWSPKQAKYSVEGYVPVTEADVQRFDNNNQPFFIVVLAKAGTLRFDTTLYEQKGKTNDYQFDLYASPPRLTANKYWLMDIIATGKNLSYDFICIMDKSFISKPEHKNYQAGLFLEDIKEHFREIEK